MKLLFLRHGIAEDRSRDGSDQSRRLTPEGVEVMRREAVAIARLDLRIGLILSSPLVRAYETADIVATALGMSDRLREEARLGLGFGLHHLRTIMGANTGQRSLMLVGHEPGMSVVVGQMIGGGEVEMKKGSLAIVEADHVEVGSGRLRMLVPASVLALGDGAL
ncbi:MAG: phosphohistidine phosphatase SixA [Armatimonadetes bacterium]|nr:phosphohistidine phosphatase SixA [Armatimonadota bacterium]